MTSIQQLATGMISGVGLAVFLTASAIAQGEIPFPIEGEDPVPSSEPSDIVCCKREGFTGIPTFEFMARADCEAEAESEVVDAEMCASKLNKGANASSGSDGPAKCSGKV